MRHWFFLIYAITLEVAGRTSMKLSGGFTKLIPSTLIFVFYAASFVALTFALRGIDVSLAYAIWSGIGTVLNSNYWHSAFSGTSGSIKIISIGLIVAGVAGLNLSVFKS